MGLGAQAHRIAKELSVDQECLGVTGHHDSQAKVILSALLKSGGICQCWEMQMLPVGI